MSEEEESRLQELIKRVEVALSDAREGVLKQSEAEEIVQDIRARVPKILHDDSRARRVFERDTQETVWWDEDGASSASCTNADADNIQHWLSALKNAMQELRKEILAALISDINAQKDLMIAAATGGPRIQTVDDEYQQRQIKVRKGVLAIGLEDPNKFNSLWDWYGRWSAGDLPTYQSRRKYISELYEPVLSNLSALQAPGTVPLPSIEPTGWARVDRDLDAIIRRLAEASIEAEFQAVGLLCGEGTISLAQAVYDPSRHNTSDGVTPSSTDAFRMLEAYIGTELAGGRNETARSYAKSALKLANELQHNRTADFRLAALCAEATRALINMMAILSGRRDPDK